VLEKVVRSDVLAWLGLEASGFGFQNPQAKPKRLALAWLWLGFGLALAWLGLSHGL